MEKVVGEVTQSQESVTSDEIDAKNQLTTVEVAVVELVQGDGVPSDEEATEDAASAEELANCIEMSTISEVSTKDQCIMQVEEDQAEIDEAVTNEIQKTQETATVAVGGETTQNKEITISHEMTATKEHATVAVEATGPMETMAVVEKDTTKAEDNEINEVVATIEETVEVVEVIEGQTNDATKQLGPFYSLEELKKPIDGVEWSRREDFLSDDDFKLHFGFLKSDFEVMSLWKRQGAKKKLGIF